VLTVLFFVQIDKVLESLKITDEQLIHIMHILEEEMSAGLSPLTHKQSTVKMFPTYVRNIPNGTEIGQVLAFDLGGTNFRVLLIDLRGNAKVELTSKIFVIPQSIMIGDGKHVRILLFFSKTISLFFFLI
jgi:hexokinase